jgi:K+-transporting ATPase ATPase B chain
MKIHHQFLRWAREMAGALKNFLFANFVTSLAEERGKGEFGLLSKTRGETVAYRLTEGDEIEEVKPRKLRPGDRVVVKAGQVVPGDGKIMQGTAAIDESAITGESAPAICEAEGVRTCVSAGTLVVSGQIVVQISSSARRSFLDRLILLVGGALQHSKARSKPSSK